MANAERPCELYRITHRESGKDYVGITTCGAKARWGSHISRARNGSATHFHRALVAYGPEAFDWKVIARARNAECGKELERMARHLGMGAYNLTMGGEGLLDPSPETRAKMRASHLGQRRGPHSEETKAKIRAAQARPDVRAKVLAAITGRPVSEKSIAALVARSKGRIVSAETRAKISAAQRGRKASEETRARMRATAQAKRARKQAAKAES
jgi:NUMOD3 motif